MALFTRTLVSALNILNLLPLATCKLINNNDDQHLLPPQQHQQTPLAHPLGAPSANDPFLVTAVLNFPSPPYHAVIECWALSTPFNTYPTIGKALSLGDTANATYVVLPAGSAEGWHRPPSDMYFILLSGAAHVHAPSPLADIDKNKQHAHEHLYIKPSLNQLIIAIDSDRRAPGHLTYYPGDTETVALQVPFRDGIIPSHTFIKAGACEGPTHEVDESYWG